MKKTFTAEEVNNIENQAYETGLAAGKYAEQKKLIDLIESIDEGCLGSSTATILNVGVRLH